jgi:uncharacterized protein YaeQ
MQLQVTVQDGHLWVSTDHGNVEIQPLALKSAQA